MIRSIALATALATSFALTAAAQDKPVAPPITAAAPAATPMMLTAEQAQQWGGKPVYSSDGKKLGEVAAFAREKDDTVTEMHIDIGGFLGLGETRVKLTPTQFKLQADRVVLDVTSADAKSLPPVAK